MATTEEDTMCQGKALKASAAAAIRICAQGNARPHLKGLCHLSARRQGDFTSLICSCGLVCILHSGADEMAQSFSLTSRTVTIDDAMNALARWTLILVSLNLPRSLTLHDTAMPWEEDAFGTYVQSQLDINLGECRELRDEFRITDAIRRAQGE